MKEGIKILKASAGSGKTYNLSKTYLELLLDSTTPQAYRHILAVTFTNKATAEMKNRILNDLAEKSKNDPKSKKLLIDILHDYSALQVSTIDKFFQRTLKAFSREIGQFSDYQIELDRDSLIRETMDRILDGLSEEKKALIDWINYTVADNLSKGDKPKIEKSLYEMGAMLKNEDHRNLVEKLGIDEKQLFSKERLSELRRECRKVLSNEEDTKDPLYTSAQIIDKLIFSLGLAGEFYNEFEKLTKEKNVLCLDESNTILRNIIDGSDAPFVYEKLGVRFDNFLLDEFQDTSNVQWDNFLPLLQESVSKGGKNLIVGDVKQSVYRFRGSEWKLLGTEVKKSFPNAEEEVLDQNWRSTKSIVDFNNRLFTFLANKLNLSNIYSDVVQKTTKDIDGCVRVDFTDNQEDTIIASIEDVRKQGANWQDIAILVRNNSEGSELAKTLIEMGYPVMSDESLKVKTSLIVSRLCCLLKAYDKPQDSINQYLIREIDVNLDETFAYHSLTDLCEELLRKLKTIFPDVFDGETLFIQAFMDELQNWTSLNGNNISSFLDYWNEQDPSIASPEDSNAIRILTIHKSKGLQFPHIIFPYAEKVKRFKAGVKWCELSGYGRFNGIYPINLSSKSENTLFANEYYDEARQQLIDNINIFYVALTRPSASMHIIAKQPSKDFKTKLATANKKLSYPDFSTLLYEFVGQVDSYTLGTPYDFTKQEKKEQGIVSIDFPSSYNSIPISDRLQLSSETEENSIRLRGIVLHDILSEIDDLSQINTAVEKAVKDGRLPKAEQNQTIELLSSRIASHPKWFSKENKVLKEQTIIDSNGKEFRPDRVIINERKVTIIDYKFGEGHDPRYLSQIKHYVSLYKRLGYEIEDALLWYVMEDIVVIP